MTNSLVMNGNQFIELTSDEMMFVDGGNIWKGLAGAAGAILIGSAPLIGIAAGIGGSVVGTPIVGVGAGIAASSFAVGYGANLLDYATSK